jgi:hypothetical protein
VGATTEAQQELDECGHDNLDNFGGNMFVNNRLSYEFAPNEKAAMIMLLDQFAERYETIHFIKNCLTVQGSVVLDTQEAIILACLVAPYWPHIAERIEAHPGIERKPALTPEESELRTAELLERVS